MTSNAHKNYNISICSYSNGIGIGIRRIVIIERICPMRFNDSIAVESITIIWP